jgi:hypothetical protein
MKVAAGSKLNVAFVPSTSLPLRPGDPPAEGKVFEQRRRSKRGSR